MSVLGKIMALDVGNARVGVALSDALQITAQPHQTIEGTGKKTSEKIIEIVSDQKIKKIVVGLPLELNGAEGPQAEAVRKFVEKLSESLKNKALEVEIIFFDERFTTKGAERILAGSKLKNKDRSAALDRISAALILEGYLGTTQR